MKGLGMMKCVDSDLIGAVFGLHRRGWAVGSSKYDLVTYWDTARHEECRRGAEYYTVALNCVHLNRDVVYVEPIPNLSVAERPCNTCGCWIFPEASKKAVFGDAHEGKHIGRCANTSRILTVFVKR
jgi:hypothetical protein